MQAFLSSLIKRLSALKSMTNVFLSCQSFFLQGKSWDIVGMGFSKVPKVLGDERLVPNPLGVNDWVPLVCPVPSHKACPSATIEPCLAFISFNLCPL